LEPERNRVQAGFINIDDTALERIKHESLYFVCSSTRRRIRAQFYELMWILVLFIKLVVRYR